MRNGNEYSWHIHMMICRSSLNLVISKLENHNLQMRNGNEYGWHEIDEATWSEAYW